MKAIIDRWWNAIGYGPFRAIDVNDKTQNLAGFTATRDMVNRLADHIERQQEQIESLKSRIEDLEN